MRVVHLTSLSLVVTLFLLAVSAGHVSTGLAAEIEPPEIAGRYAIVIDGDSGQILYEKQATTRTAPASLTKLFTAFLALELAPLNRSLVILPEDLVGDSNPEFQPGDVRSLEQMLSSLVLQDGNGAAMSISRNLGKSDVEGAEPTVDQFLAIANARLASLGLINTNLENPHGIDQIDHHTTARDVAALTMYAIKHQPEFAAIIGAAGATQIADGYPGMSGGMTTSTENAGSSLVEIIQQESKTLIAVVMGSTPNALYADAANMLDFGLYVSLNATELPFGQIAFADQLPENPLLVEKSDPLTLQVITNGETASVSLNMSESAGSWSLIKWPFIALLVSIVLLVSCGQLTAYQQQLQRQRKYQTNLAQPFSTPRRFTPSGFDRPQSQAFHLQTVNTANTSQSALSGD